jgi:hypothetical protein
MAAVTVRPPRIAPGGLNVPEVNRSLAELASGADAAVSALLLAGAAMLEVPASESANALFFATSRRIYSLPSPDSPGTRDVRIYNSGETIVQHRLNRKPNGRFVAGQSASSILFDLDVAALNPPLDPAKFVAYRSTASALFRIVLF